MTTKTTVAEFRDFYNDETVWANEAWYEDLGVTINGHEVDDDIVWTNIPEDLDPSSPMTISGGVIYRPKTKGSQEKREINMESEFKRWRKARALTAMVATIPNEEIEGFKAYVRLIGGKVS
ncbi:MAG: hypothetical protein DDT25_00244 [Chloroflexi bacterium]|nr:hypothetical protein [Chloroflexota bacterium]